MSATGRWQPKHTVTVVVALLFAAVLTPIAAGAVATQPVTLFDHTGVLPVNVTGSNALEVDTRHGTSLQRIAVSTVTGIGRARTLMGLNASKTLNVTELTFSSSATATAGFVNVQFVRFARSSGTNTCSTVDSTLGTPSGFVFILLHQVSLPAQGSVAVSFADQPLNIITGTTALSCLAVRIQGGPGSGSTSASISMVGYGN